ncbi:sensor histidine kinase [Mucilaginibacter rubeus]|uniref:histidine kinase n=1 Tax=Mucilaginibacter rubeus TaxID=2027860 RepID=A0A5C1I1E3_9SPHI|nr:sensor histidine kinase [Mucilaginibacter rubeus]QEM11733.1 sensor histidine kinase [Mucilaginibacter rubeus]
MQNTVSMEMTAKSVYLIGVSDTSNDPVLVTIGLQALKVGPLLLATTFLCLVCLYLMGLQMVRRIRRQHEKSMKILETEKRRLENEVAKLGQRSEWLEAEMHHRVKNNLQIMSSLINSQFSFTNDRIGKETLTSSRHRLYALSLVHQKLFLHPAGTEIEMSCCIKDLVDYLVDEFNKGTGVQFEMDLVSLKIDPATAIPFALIINELVTNSLKYAFPGDRTGIVRIRLLSGDDNNYQLIYADDGIGLPEDFDFYASGSLGKTLILGLSRQIRGKVTINKMNGLEIAIDFKIKSSSPGILRYADE